MEVSHCAVGGPSVAFAADCRTARNLCDAGRRFECAKPGTYTLEDVLRPHPLEERIDRMRCVEGWSMVIPWVGFPLRDLVKRFEPNGNARFVEFTTLPCVPLACA
jgi:Oxidoreductase molybdopterin binding domain